MIDRIPWCRGHFDFWGFLLGLDSGLVLDVIKKTKAAVKPGGFAAAAVSRQINIYPQPQNQDVVI